MFYLVETQIIRENNTDNFKWLIYLEDPDLAKKAIYNHLASYGNPSAIIFKTFREATEKEKLYSMFDEEHYARGSYLNSYNKYYFVVCSIY